LARIIQQQWRNQPAEAIDQNLTKVALANLAT